MGGWSGSSPNDVDRALRWLGVQCHDIRPA
jgi:hypothetical protein